MGNIHIYYAFEIPYDFLGKMKILYFLLYTLLMTLLISAQDIDELILLQAKAENYYHQGDYSNAIIVFEDLLAEQEIAFGKNDIRVGETLQQLGEMYSISDMPDIADYYFHQAIIIFQDSFQILPWIWVGK